MCAARCFVKPLLMQELGQRSALMVDGGRVITTVVSQGFFPQQQDEPQYEETGTGRRPEPHGIN